MSISKKMDKYTVVYLYKEILHGHKKEKDIESCSSLSEVCILQIKLNTKSIHHMNSRMKVKKMGKNLLREFISFLLINNQHFFFMKFFFFLWDQVSFVERLQLRMVWLFLI